MSNTTAMRTAWASDRCTHMPGATFIFWNGTRININRRAAQAFQALDNVFRKYGFSPPQVDTGCYNCRVITGGNLPSLHSFGIAVDVDWLNNPYQTPAQYAKGLKTNMKPAMIGEIKGILTVDGLPVWGWGGDYTGNKDTMHFELHVGPEQLARGVRNTITPIVTPAAPVPDSQDPIKEKFEMIAAFIINRDGHAEYLSVDHTDNSPVDFWQDPDGSMKSAPLNHVKIAGEDKILKGIEAIESYYDKETHTNIIMAVGYLGSPWILFRQEPSIGKYQWGEWIAWKDWAALAAQHAE